MKTVSVKISMTEIYFSQQSVPPVMAFHLGSLGFLTPFEFDNFQEQVTNVLEGNVLFYSRSFCGRLQDFFITQS
jgi:NAD kinase